MQTYQMYHWQANNSLKSDTVSGLWPATVPLSSNVSCLPTNSASLEQLMNTSVVEIVKWKSAPGITDQAMIEAALALVPDLKSIGGFIDKTLYKNGNEWVDIYYWETAEETHLSNERMANKESLSKLFSLVQPDTVSITVMSKA